MWACRGEATTVKATGRSGLLACEAAEMAGVPIGQVHYDDLDRSLRNLALGIPGGIGTDVTCNIHL